MMEALELFAIMMAVFVPISFPFLFSAYLNYKKQTEVEIAKLRKKVDSNSVSDLQKEILEIKERLVTLERIVTDRGYEVERKISNL